MNGSARGKCAALAERLTGEEGLSYLLLFLFLALFLGPVLDRPTRPLTTLTLSLVMVAGVANVSRRLAVRVVAGVAALAAIALRLSAHLMPSPPLLRLSSWASLIFMVMLTGVILVKVFTDERRVTGNVIRGAVAAYLLFGITWSILYNLLDQTIPGSFNVGGARGADEQERFVYFSFVTLTTVGYGDITPAHDISRMFAVTEALLGQLYPATLLARLVSLEVSHRERRAGGKPSDAPPKGDDPC